MSLWLGVILLMMGLFVGITSNTLVDQIHSKVFAQPAPPVQPPTAVGTFKGVVEVIDPIPPVEGGRTRMAGIKVLVHGTSLSTLTDSNGNFSIDNVPVGKFVLVQAYRIDTNLPTGTGNSVLTNPGQFRFGAYIPTNGATVDLDILEVNFSEVGAP